LISVLEAGRKYKKEKQLSHHVFINGTIIFQKLTETPIGISGLELFNIPFILKH